MDISNSAFWFGASLAAFTSCAEPSRRPEPGVLVGSQLVSKEIFVANPGIGEIVAMAYGRLDGEREPALILLGSLGGALVEPESKQVLRSFALESTQPPGWSGAEYHGQIVDLDGDGDLDIVRLAQTWFSRTSLHASDGRAIWAHPPPVGPEGDELNTIGTWIGDVDSDGRLEVLIAYQSKRVDLLDTSGELRWTADWGPCEVVFDDVDHDGRDDIVHCGEEELVARSGKAEVLVRTKLPDGGYVNALERLRDVGDPPRDCLLVGHYVAPGRRGGQNFHLVELDAKTIGERVEWDDVETHREATDLRFEDDPALAFARSDQLEEQAPIAGISATWLRLRLMDRRRDVLYDEILAPPGKPTTASDGALLFLPASSAGPSQLLVAYGVEIWSYTPASRTVR